MRRAGPLHRSPRADADPDPGVTDWELLDRRDFLRKSLADAEQEHTAGDLSGADYELLRRRDEERLAAVEAAIATRAQPVPAAIVTPEAPGATAAPEAPDSPAPPGPRRRRRRWLALGGVAAIAAGAVLLVVDLTAPRLPGQAATGGVTLNAAQQVERELAQARSLVAAGQEAKALQLYGQVLVQDPRDPVALAEWGWLDWQAAARAKQATAAAEGASAIEEATRLDPALYAAQYYLGTILLREGDPAKATVHYAAFLADHPPRSWVAQAAGDIRTAYTAAHRPVPPAVGG